MCEYVIILERVHLLGQVVAGQAVVQAQVRFPGDGHPHDLVQVSGGSSRLNQTHTDTTFVLFCSKYNKIIKANKQSPKEQLRSNCNCSLLFHRPKKPLWLLVEGHSHGMKRCHLLGHLG